MLSRGISETRRLFVDLADSRKIIRHKIVIYVHVLGKRIAVENCSRHWRLARLRANYATRRRFVASTLDWPFPATIIIIFPKISSSATNYDSRFSHRTRSPVFRLWEISAAANDRFGINKHSIVAQACVRNQFEQFQPSEWPKRSVWSSRKRTIVPALFQARPNDVYDQAIIALTTKRSSTLNRSDNLIARQRSTFRSLCFPWARNVQHQ